MRKAKIFKKCLVYTLIGALTLSNVTPALAYDHLDKVDYDSNKNSIAEVHEEVNVTEDGTSQATVYAELGKEFTITVPKSLTLSGQTKSGTYTVSVEGDIAGTDKINVIPDETFTLNSSGLDSITASINQDKTSWMYNEITDNAVIGNGTIDAKDLTAGKWNGTFNFNINLEEDTGSGNTGNEEQSILTLSVDDEVAIGADDSLQVNAYMDGQIVNNQVNWQSDNENITVTNGLIKTKASAQVGDTATITVTAENPDTLSAMANTLNDLGIATVAMAEDDISIDFTVTIVDIEYSVDEINLKPGESIDVTAKVIPEEINGTVYWSQTAISGINLIKDGNTVTINVADDMGTGTYELVATYGDYSKTLTINIIADHVCNYTETITKNATCMETGIKTFNCTCGNSYTEEIPVDNNAHDYESEWTTTLEPTCTEKGTSVQYCSFCTYALNEKEIAETGHSFGEWTEVESPKCEATGSEQRKCNTCGYTETNDVSATGHNWEDDYTIDVPATCETDGSKSVHCENCDATKYSTVIPKLGHSYPDTWEITKAATCTEKGSEQKVCGTCGDTIIQEIPATGHSASSAVKENEIKSTCTETGSYNSVVYCSVCNTKLNSQTIETAALGHDFNNWTTIESSTCTKAGYEQRTCDVCGLTETNNLEIADHSWNADYTIDKAATCEEAGSKSIHCTNCEATKDSVVIEATGHTYSSFWTTEKEATCTETGLEQRICINDGCGKVETREVKATGHTEVIDAAVEATCTTTGLTEGKHCSVCNEILITQEEIPAGHNYENGTCTKCGEADPDYVLEAGLYDANGTMLCSWEESGINVETNYTSSTYKTNAASPYYVLTNKYPTTSKIVVSDKVTKIGRCAFYKCNNLTEIILPDSVTSIDSFVFNYCTNLTHIIIPDSITSFGTGNFISCTNLTSIGEVGSGASVEIPNTITSIGDETFSDCTGITSVTIPSYISDIGIKAFYGCTNIKDLTISEGVINVGEGAFAKCTSLTNVLIPNSMTKIGYSMFAGCTGLTSIGEVGSGASVEIPPTVTTIGASAFSNCSNLVDVTIPDSITTIEKTAFQSCTSLTTFYIPKTVTKIVTSTSTGSHYVSYAPFYGCSNNLKIYCGASSRPSGYEKYAFYYGTSKYYTETYGITREDYIENYK